MDDQCRKCRSCPPGANIDDLITAGVDVIIARAFDSGAIGRRFKAAKDAGIPFVTFDRGSTSGKPTAHVGGDSYDQARSTGLAFRRNPEEGWREGK